MCRVGRQAGAQGGGDIQRESEVSLLVEFPLPSGEVRLFLKAFN